MFNTIALQVCYQLRHKPGLRESVTKGK